MLQKVGRKTSTARQHSANVKQMAELQKRHTEGELQLHSRRNYEQPKRTESVKTMEDIREDEKQKPL